MGPDVGLCVGEEVGLSVEFAVGPCVGETVGLCVGDPAGPCVGEIVGLAVGELVSALLVLGPSQVTVTLKLHTVVKPDASVASKVLVVVPSG